MVKSNKKLFAVLGVLLSMFIILSMFAMIDISKSKTKVSASELSSSDISTRRATPGLYETDNTHLLVSWNDLLTNGIVAVTDGQLSISTDISSVTESEQADLVFGVLTETVTSMSNMCSYDEEGGTNCTWLTGIDFNALDTSSVEDMSSMLMGCTNLISINFGTSFNTQNVTNMASMFADCCSLESLDLSTFDTSNVTDMSFMFSGLTLTELDLRNFNTSSVTDMSYMLISCAELTSLNLSSFNTENVEDMSDMFTSCSTITKLDLSNFKTPNLTSTNSMFMSCSSLTSVNVSSFDTSNVTNMGSMFMSCSALSELKLSNFNTENVYNGMVEMFSFCEKLVSLDISNFHIEGRSGASDMLNWCRALKTLKAPKYISSFASITLPTTADGYFYASTTDKETHLTELTNANMGQTIELYSTSDPVTPDVPSTGVNASALIVLMPIICVALLFVLDKKKYSI